MKQKKEMKISAIEDGTVIDHIPSDRVFDVVDILNLSTHDKVVSVATNLKSKSMGIKGVIKVAGRELTKTESDVIALVAPNATINIIKNYNVKSKSKVTIPDNLASIIKCPNPSCITNKDNIATFFSAVEKELLKLKCKYCERVIQGKEIRLK